MTLFIAYDSAVASHAHCYSKTPGRALAWLDCNEDVAVTLPIVASRSIFFYVVRNSVRVNGAKAVVRELVKFNFDGMNWS